jgi:glycosyltransferase involved in cell wall biosynthesis
MTKKAKILHILPNFGLGGAERMAVHLMQDLDSGRFEVAAVSMFDRVGSDLESMLEASGIPVWYLGKRIGFDPRMFYRIDRVLHRFRPHVVHTHRYVLRYAWPPMLYRRVLGKVHTVHNLAEKEVDATGKIVHHLAFRLGVVPVAIATEVARTIQNVYGIANIPLIPNGIPLQNYSSHGSPRLEWRKREGIGDEEVVFATIGRLTRQKNQRLLLDAFARATDEWGKGKLLLVGDGEQRRELEIKVDALRLGQRVRFLGVRTDIPEILGACDVFVLSSDWEGNPLTVMEAMAAGKAVVSTAVGGVPELVVDGATGILVPAGDAAALTDALSVMLCDAEKRLEMGRAAARRAEKHFCVKVMAKRYEELYENLLAPR